MTKGELVVRTIERKDISALPYHITFCRPLETRLQDYLGTDDIDGVIGNYVEWLEIEVPWENIGDNLVRDEFGVVWKTNPFNRGYVVESPLKEPSLRGLRLPKYRYNDVLKSISGAGDRASERYKIIWVGDLLERACMLRGTEHCLTDFCLNQAFVRELLQVLADIIIRNIRAVKGSNTHGVFLSDDYGSQRGLLISRIMWVEFVKPCLKRIVDCAHECEKTFFLHSDGDIEELIPDFIELGIDVLHPVQSEVMDFNGLKKNYGRDICFYGGIGTQGNLRTACPNVVKEDIKALMSMKDGDSGFIVAPTLQLMEDIPFENVLSLIEAVQNA